MLGRDKHSSLFVWRISDEEKKFTTSFQKEKFTKLKKLRESQANLPIAEFRNEILDQGPML